MGQKQDRDSIEDESLVDDMEIMSLIEDNIDKQNELERKICKDIKIEIKCDYYIEKLVNIDFQAEEYVIQDINEQINSCEKIALVGPYLFVAITFMCCQFVTCSFIPGLKSWLKCIHERFANFIS